MFCRQLWLFLCLWPLAGAANELPDTIDSIRGSVVAVGVARPARRIADGKPSIEYRGTGFAVGAGYHVVTNHHVIEGLAGEAASPQQGETLAVFVGRGDRATVRSVTIAALDPDHDLALLQLGEPPLPPLGLGGDDLIREGEELAFTGFPLGLVLGLYPATNKAIVSAVTPVVVPAESAGALTPEMIRRLKTPYEVYQLDAIAYPGNSGSPVYRPADGKVVGIVNSVFVKGSRETMLQSPSAITYAIPVRYIRDLIDGQ